jgi:hypothetical protein
MRNKKITQKDILYNVFNTKDFNNIPFTTKGYALAAKILQKYFKYMWIALFLGHEWILPGKFGRIKIERKEIAPNDHVPFVKRYLPKTKEALNKRAFNPNTIGYYFTITITRGRWERFHARKWRYQAPRWCRRKLFDELYYGNFAQIYEQ